MSHRDGVDAAAWEELRTIVAAIEHGDDEGLLAYLSTGMRNDELKRFAQLSAYAGLLVGRWLEDTLGSDPSDGELRAVAETADLDFLNAQTREWLGSDALFRALKRNIAGGSDGEQPEDLLRFMIGWVIGLALLVPYPLATMTNRRAQMAADLRLLRPMNEHTQHFLT